MTPEENHRRLGEALWASNVRVKELEDALADAEARLVKPRQCRNCGWDVTVEP